MSSDLIATMRARVTRHFLTAFAGFASAFVGMLVIGTVSRPAAGEPTPRWASIGIALCIAVIPIVGFYSTFRNLRCPACEKLVAWQVSQNFSAFAPWARHDCRHCGARIFPGQESGRGAGGRRFIFIMLAVGIALGALVTAGSMFARR